MRSPDTAFFGHPAGLGFLASTQAWERFSFYGMQALLPLYLVDHLLKPEVAAGVAGLDGLRAGVEFLTGPLSTTAFAAETLAGVNGVKVAETGGVFRELLLDFSASGRSVAAVNRALLDRHGIFGGIEITPDTALFAFTECHSEADIVRLADALREVLS